MNIKCAISQIKDPQMRKTAELFADGDWLLSSRVAEKLGIKPQKATIRIRQLIRNHNFTFEFRTVMRSNGGIAHEYRLVAADGKKLVCVDVPLERSYSDGEFIAAMESLDRRSVKETLEALNDFQTYYSVQEIADKLDLTYDAVRQRLQVLERYIPNIFIHRYGGMNRMKLKLISFNRPEEYQRRETSKPKEKPKNQNKLSILNSVFN